VRQREPVADLRVLQDPVPAFDAGLAVGDVLTAQVEVQREQRGQLLGRPRAVRGRLLQEDAVLGELVVVLATGLLPAPLEAGGEVVGGVGGRLAAEQVQLDRVVEVDVLLDDV
jgi:hypothetical protein